MSVVLRSSQLPVVPGLGRRRPGGVGVRGLAQRGGRRRRAGQGRARQGDRPQQGQADRARRPSGSGIQTAAVRRSGSAAQRRALRAVLYDADGDTWTYTRPKPLAFIRAPIRWTASTATRASCRTDRRSGRAW